MSGKTKLLIFLLAFAGVGYVVKSRSQDKWAAEGLYTITKKSLPQHAKVGDIHKFSVELIVPEGDKFPTPFAVPDHVWEVANENDQIHYEKHSIPFLKLDLQLYVLQATNGRVIKEWDEGVVLYWFGLIGTSLAAGIAAVILVTILAKLCGYGRTPRD